MLDKMTKETFEPRKGESFELAIGEGGETGTIDLRLAEIRGTGLQGKATREQFALHFHGPSEPLLPQQIYQLENAEMGALEIFLVPVARDDEGVTYEAVFT